MFCKNCGFQLKDTARFCPKCGTANTPPPIPPQPSNFTPQPSNFTPQPSNFTPQPNNFAPQQNSSFSPNAQSIAVKTKKPPIIVGVGIVILIVIIIAFCIGFTGHGAGGGSKGGYKKASEAAEAAFMAQYTRDADTIMRLLPPEVKKYYEDEKNLSEKQLKDHVEYRLSYVGEKYDSNEVSVEVDDNPLERDAKWIEAINSALADYEIRADDVVYFENCYVTLDGEQLDSQQEIVYKYNGRWYSARSIRFALK